MEKLIKYSSFEELKSAQLKEKLSDEKILENHRMFEEFIKELMKNKDYLQQTKLVNRNNS